VTCGHLQGVPDTALARMKATVGWAPLVTLLVTHVPEQVVACAGEESTEAEYQARRQSVNVSLPAYALRKVCSTEHRYLLVLSASCGHLALATAYHSCRCYTLFAYTHVILSICGVGSPVLEPADIPR